MARELRDRYADMRDVLQDLQRIKENKQPVGQRRFKGAVGGKLPQVRRVLKVLWLPACVAGIAVGGWMLWRERAPGVITPPPIPRAAIPSQSAWNITTLAGQAGVGGHADGAGNQAQLRLPSNVAADRAGNVYVADTGNNTIRKISPNGTVSTLAGVSGTHGSADGMGSEARFWAPFGVAVDGAGNVYVADTVNNTIRKITPQGVVTTLAGLAGQPGSQDDIGANARFRNPWGVAADDKGNVFVADMSNNTIRKITPAGVVTTLAGQAGMTGSEDGSGGQARFNAPHGVATDHAGNVYVSDSANNTIRRIAPDGTVSTVAGLPGHPGNTDGNGNDARFWNPQGLAVDAQGNLYVADMGNNTVRKITPTKGVITLAGLAGTSGATNGNGIGKDVRFNSPGGVATDSAGNIYVADTLNHTVRRIASSASEHP